MPSMPSMSNQEFLNDCISQLTVSGAKCEAVSSTTFNWDVMEGVLGLKNTQRVARLSNRVGFRMWDLNSPKVAGMKVPATKSPKSPKAPAVSLAPRIIPQNVETQAVSKVGAILNNSSLAYVPRQDPNFVAFGIYSNLLTAIRSNCNNSCNIFIFGDSGNGKTLAVEQACAKLNRKLVTVQVNEESSIDDLFGHYQLVDGNTQFVPGRAIIAAEQGAVLLLDEVDRGSAKLYDLLMGLLAGREITVEKTGQVIYPQPGFMVIATANTTGRGDDTGRFVGAKVINEAFLERFDIYLNQDYPDDRTEEKILRPFMPDEASRKKLVAFAQAVRKSYQANTIDNHITTRRLVMIARQANIFDLNTALRLCVTRFDASTRASLMKSWELISPTQESAKIPENVDNTNPF